MNHHQLIHFANQLGYKTISENGLCFGYSMMWAQAVCNEDLSSFKKRLSLLEHYRNQIPFIDEIEFLGLPFMLEFDADPSGLNKDINNVRELNKKTIANNKNPNNPKYQLTSKQKELLEIPAFFEGIAGYLHPESFEFRGLFGDNIYGQKDFIALSAYFQSKELEDSGGLSLQFSTMDEYDENSLENYLDEINKKLKDRPNAAVIFSCNNHTVSLRVVGDNQFEFMDVNYPEQRCNKSRLKNQLFTSFSQDKNKPLVLETNILTKQSLPLENMKELAATTPINALTPNRKGLTLLELAAFNNDINTLKRINFEKIEINNPNGAPTALMFACLGLNEDAIDYLLAFKPDTSYALNIIACVLDHDKAFKLAKKIVNHDNSHLNDTKSKDGQPINPPLFQATLCNNAKLVDLLLQNGADPSFITKDNKTSLHIACTTGNQEIVSLLLNNKTTDCNIRDEFGTPLMHACNNNNVHLIPLLLHKTTIYPEDVKQNSALFNKILTYDGEMQKNFLKQALTSYIEERNKGDDYLSLTGSLTGFSKSEKIEAAKELENALENNTPLALKHLKALTNGNLSHIFNLYQHLQIKPKTETIVKVYKDSLNDLKDHNDKLSLEPKAPRI